MSLPPCVIPQDSAFYSGCQILSGGITGCRHTENTLSVADVFPPVGDKNQISKLLLLGFLLINLTPVVKQNID